MVQGGFLNERVDWCKASERKGIEFEGTHEEAKAVGACGVEDEAR